MPLLSIKHIDGTYLDLLLTSGIGVRYRLVLMNLLPHKGLFYTTFLVKDLPYVGSFDRVQVCMWSQIRPRNSGDQTKKKLKLPTQSRTLFSVVLLSLLYF
jgi:hypothetical protein